MARYATYNSRGKYLIKIFKQTFILAKKKDQDYYEIWDYREGLSYLAFAKYAIKKHSVEFSIIGEERKTNVTIAREIFPQFLDNLACLLLLEEDGGTQAIQTYVQLLEEKYTNFVISLQDISLRDVLDKVSRRSPELKNNIKHLYGEEI